MFPPTIEGRHSHYRVFFFLLPLLLRRYLYGTQEPNPDDPLNKEAAQLMIDRPSEFESNVRRSLQGGYFMNRQFPKLK